MIFDKLENYKNYEGLSNGIERAFEFLHKTDLNNLNPGKYLIDNDNIYAVCMEYETKLKSLSKNEAHKKYIDIQYIVKGKEMISVGNIQELSVTKKYSEENDVIFYEKRNQCEFILKKGYFAVFFPEDAHIPGYNIDGSQEMIKKIVIKVHV